MSANSNSPTRQGGTTPPHPSAPSAPSTPAKSPLCNPKQAAPDFSPPPASASVKSSQEKMLDLMNKLIRINGKTGGLDKSVKLITYVSELESSGCSAF